MIKWYGIKDDCCTNLNINRIRFNSDYGQCDICKRVFKSEPSVRLKS